MCPFSCFMHVTLDVDYDNTGAIDFYRKLGFSYVGTKTVGYPQYHMRCDVDRLLLQDEADASNLDQPQRLKSVPMGRWVVLPPASSAVDSVAAGQS
jgi:hypothetical protein